MLSIKALQKQIGRSELGQEWIYDPLMNQDIWSLAELGYSEEECRIYSRKNIYLDSFDLPWLKLLAKLTVKASIRSKFSLGNVVHKVETLKKLDTFLVNQGHYQPETITDSLLQKFIADRNSGNRQATIGYAVRLWADEEWLKLPYIFKNHKKCTPKIEVIPEEVLYQIYENFDLFPPSLERLFRLQILLGCRIGEMLKMPRKSLKKEDDKWFLLRWVEKRKHWQFYQIHHLVAELVQEQQRFLNIQFGNNSSFDKLFCKLSTANLHGASQGKRFEVEPIYMPDVLSHPVVCLWLRDFSKKADLKDKHNNRFNLKSHMFRRTKASIMAYCEAEDEYIAAVLGHGSLDMLPHYRQRSLERLEKKANAKSYVDMYGRVTNFKPRKRQYEKLAEIIETKVTTSLGECHRPVMLGNCQYRYACLSCGHHRVTEEDKPKIEADIESLDKDLARAKVTGQERRVTEINQLLKLLKTRLQGLNQILQTKNS